MTQPDSSNSIKFTALLKPSDKDRDDLKLIFNTDWDYDPADFPEYVQAKLGYEKRRFNLLEMYRQGKAKLVQESTKSHDPSNRRFKNGDIVFCFIHYDNQDWLLVNAFKVLNDSKIIVDIDEDYMAQYRPYFGRLVITWAERNARNIRMVNKQAIEGLTVKTILEQPYDELSEEFPGYENIDLSWRDLGRVLKLKTWKTALENQKGVYLITDTATNKRYVGSASGDEMILGRWEAYAKNGHGGNKELAKLAKSMGDDKWKDYIEKNFRYSILDIFKPTTDEKIILAREQRWKEVLLTNVHNYPEFGYNAN